MAKAVQTEIEERLHLVNHEIKLAKRQILYYGLPVGFAVYFLVRSWMGIEDDKPYSLTGIGFHLFILSFFCKIFDWHALWVERKVLRKLNGEAGIECHSRELAEGKKA